MTTSDKDRAAFEAAYRKEFPHATKSYLWRDEKGNYFLADINHAWLFWQAATAAERERAAKACIAFGKTLEVDVGENFAEAIRSGE